MPLGCLSEGKAAKDAGLLTHWTEPENSQCANPMPHQPEQAAAQVGSRNCGSRFDPRDN